MPLNVLPLQPFKLMGQTMVSSSQLESLTQLYQPIIGSRSVSLYLSLMTLPQAAFANELGLMRHQQLLVMLNMGINDLNKARLKLEAVGLLKIYRDSQSNPKREHQTVIYQLQLPKPATTFFNDALLNTALAKQLGEGDYNLRQAYYLTRAVDVSLYMDETAHFGQVFYPTDLTMSTESESGEKYYPSELDYSRFLSYLMADNINHGIITAQLKDKVYALYEVYGFKEDKLAQLVYLSIDKATSQVDYTMLTKLADKEGKPINQEGRVNKSVAAPTPKSYNKEELVQRMQQIQTTYPQLSKEDLQLVLSCEQLPVDVFLDKIKQAKNAFTTDNERYYVKDLLGKSKLGDAVVNFLVYKLLVLDGRPNVFKGELQRTASAWQQAHLTTVPQAVTYVRAQIQSKESQNNNGNKPTTYQRRSGQSRKDIVPDWVKGDGVKKEDPNKPPQEKPTVEADGETEASLRQRLNELLGGDSHATD